MRRPRLRSRHINRRFVAADKAAKGQGKVRELFLREGIDPQSCFELGNDNGETKRIHPGIVQCKIVGEGRELPAVVLRNLVELSHYHFSYVHEMTCLPFKTEPLGLQSRNFTSRAVHLTAPGSIDYASPDILGRCLADVNSILAWRTSACSFA